MQQEVSIHSKLSHENIVGFHLSFEDADFVYIILELCPRRVNHLPLHHFVDVDGVA